MTAKDDLAKQTNKMLRDAYFVYDHAVKNADFQKRMLEGETLKQRVYGLLKPLSLELLEDKAFCEQIKKWSSMILWIR